MSTKSTTLTAAGAAGLTALLLVPATSAQAANGPIPPIRTGVSDGCAIVKVEFRTSVGTARTAKRAAYAAAKATWRSSVASDWTVLKGALANADTHAERKTAIKTFHRATAPERLARGSAKKSARIGFRASLHEAHKNLRAGMRTCS